MRNRVRSKAMRTEESGFCVDCSRVDQRPETRRGISATGFIYLPLCCGCVASLLLLRPMGWDGMSFGIVLWSGGSGDWFDWLVRGICVTTILLSVD